jgi:alpha(1,3/1,4) fucosyltransferase
MFVGNIVGWSAGNDDIFDINSLRNRDDCLQPYRILKENFLSRGVFLHTPDVSERLGLKIDFNLYVESELNLRPELNYLLRMESEFIVPINGNLNYLNQFDLIFTWDDFLVDGLKYIKINYPNAMSLSFNDGYKNRSIFSCMISGNKFLTKPDDRELYTARVDAIKWFEKNHPDDFHLFGLGWDKPARKKSGFPKFKYRVERQFNKILGRESFPSYKGPVVSKRNVLEKSKFCICYENIQNVPGYITEKIFDCFFAGCIPIYLGDPRISDHIPLTCYVDRHSFKNMNDLYSFLKEMPESTYLNYQNEIRKFILSDKFHQFSAINFADIIVSNILTNLTNKVDS